MSGELALRAGKRYYVTPTHPLLRRCAIHAELCWNGSGQTHKRDTVANRVSLLASNEMRRSPAANPEYTACSGSNFTEDVVLFPVNAEAQWLSIMNIALYNTEPENVEARRVKWARSAPNSRNLCKEMICTNSTVRLRVRALKHKPSIYVLQSSFVMNATDVGISMGPLSPVYQDLQIPRMHSCSACEAVHDHPRPL